MELSANADVERTGAVSAELSTGEGIVAGCAVSTVCEESSTGVVGAKLKSGALSVALYVVAGPSEMKLVDTEVYGNAELREGTAS